ncbi:hypothetical protein BDW69DRAFT_30008 [Aspergillus filifer]
MPFYSGSTRSFNILTFLIQFSHLPLYFMYFNRRERWGGRWTPIQAGHAAKVQYKSRHWPASSTLSQSSSH